MNFAVLLAFVRRPFILVPVSAFFTQENSLPQVTDLHNQPHSPPSPLNSGHQRQFNDQFGFSRPRKNSIPLSLSTKPKAE
jgi:hypothetical protein